MDQLGQPWQRVRLKVLGPFKGKIVLMMADEMTKFRVAEVLEHKKDLEKVVAHRVFHLLCQYGFAKVIVDVHELVKFANLSRELGVLVSTVQMAIDDILEEASEDELGDAWPCQEVEDLANQSENLEASLSVSVWHHNRKCANERSPYLAMFGREASVSSATKSGSRRKIQSTLLKCRHCSDTFTSRISFQIHQKHHLELSRKSGCLPGEDTKRQLDADDEPELVNRKRTRLGAKAAQPVDPEARLHILKKNNPEKMATVSSSPAADLQTSTVKTVSKLRAFFDATREERNRRGKYSKYSPELSNDIAEYAETYGVSAAAKEFQKRLKAPITVSTIRNFVKGYRSQPKERKLEIGKFAYQFGSEPALQHFKATVPDLKLSLVKQFMAFFLKSNPHLPQSDESADAMPLDLMPDATGQSHVPFHPELRVDIGRYAFHCGNSAAVKNFSAKLKFPLKESTVRKFKKEWMERNHVTDQHQPQPQIIQLQSNQIQNGQGSQIQSSHASLIPLPLTTTKEPSSVNGKALAGSSKVASSNAEAKPRRQLKARKGRSKASGAYANYPPELRGLIGSYATSHSIVDTITFFSKNHGVDLPESTVRGLRDKYLLKQNSTNETQELTRMDFEPRGRPMSLGKYDEVVLKCIKELVDAGEKLTSFLAVATAKQVLQEHEPSLLAENGGKVTLGASWAKSVLKRIRASSASAKGHGHDDDDDDEAMSSF